MDSNHRFPACDAGVVAAGPRDHALRESAAAGDNRQRHSPPVFTASRRLPPDSSRGGNRTHTITGSRPARFACLRTRPFNQSRRSDLNRRDTAYETELGPASSPLRENSCGPRSCTMENQVYETRPSTGPSAISDQGETRTPTPFVRRAPGSEPGVSAIPPPGQRARTSRTQYPVWESNPSGLFERQATSTGSRTRHS